MNVLQYTSPEFAADCVKLYVSKARKDHRHFVQAKRAKNWYVAVEFRSRVVMDITCARFWSLYVKGILK